MKALVLIPLVGLLGCAAAPGVGLGDPDGPIEGELTPTAFGDEQTLMYGIRSGIGLESAPGGAGRRGTITVRGEPVAVGLMDGSGGPEFAADTNRNGTLEETEFRSGSTSVHEVTMGEDVVVVEASLVGQGVEFVVREMWTARIEHEGEVLALGVLRFERGAMQLTDNDLDGVFESILPPGGVVPLGGRGWIIGLDFDARAVSLEPTDRVPVAAGFSAPRLEVSSHGGEELVPLIRDGEVTVLLFCHTGCAGCRMLDAQLPRLQSRFSADESVRFVSIARSAGEAAAMAVSICPDFEHVVSNDAWASFAVRTTPTMMVIDATGEIVNRSMWTGQGTANALRDAIESAM